MQKDAAQDQELTLKKRARRRLVGAIALVLLMIIVLPILLKDRVATAPTDEITISLPNELHPAADATNTGINKTGINKPSDFDSSIVPTEAANSSVAQKPKVADNAQVDASQAQIPETQATETQVPATQVKTPLVKDSLPNAPEKLKTDAMHKFYVQIGVFSDEANVKQLQAKLTDLGYKSQTEKITTVKGQKIRLRTQVFADRNDAAIALENIKDAGLTGMVVSL